MKPDDRTHPLLVEAVRSRSLSDKIYNPNLSTPLDGIW